ncbi:hypothetical protein CEUSTIGMA_g2815.t1 [Chlamydomonas eustigma]|uniref:RRM domain-containing protein n=1 Tax=Chlamydomonas eustigma TaxID=1157962 RepID=A0A250WX30_9CHLO|nr:hypothetical protein CEUSTIGMA_g2815.t1 [Chlamydomonas eustigma]|eukprot:GAX75371.1 hypothetical protein CEUSTIGMA_g2815.t1 [Chlamydomonas eustigma]
MHSRNVEPVCADPKIFVGQVPVECSKDDVANLFKKYGEVSNVILMTQSKPLSAMVLFTSWSSVEIACEAEHGNMSLGGSKPLVVKVADPPKMGPGITPKKLFVGQIPSNATEDHLREIFEPCGNIVDLALLKKNPGAACAFVTYERWAHCEAAIAAHHETTVMEGAKMPLVVKFADAKIGDGAAGAGGMNMKRPFNDANGSGLSNKKQFNGMMGGFPGYNMGMSNGYDMSGMGISPMAMGGMGYGMGMNPMASMMGGMAMNGMGPGMGAPGMAGMGGMGGMGAGMNLNGMNTGMVNGMNAGMMGGMNTSMGPGIMGGGMSNAGMMGGGMMGGGMNAGVASVAGSMNMPGRSVQNSMASSSRGVATQGKLGDQQGGAAKQWKLFIGQVPFEAQESDLWPIFNDLGNIQELVILKNPQGRSKGCAFLTYESRSSAEAAIEQINGKVCLPSDNKQRVLLVKYAMPGQSSAPQPSSSNNTLSLHQQGQQQGAVNQQVMGVAQPGMMQPSMGHMSMGQQGMGMGMGMGMGVNTQSMHGMMPGMSSDPSTMMYNSAGQVGAMSGLVNSQMQQPQQQGYSAGAYNPMAFQQQQSYNNVY